MDHNENRPRMGLDAFKSSREDLLFEMEFLDEESMQEMIGLQDLILGLLPHPEIFFPHDKDYFQKIFQHDRSVIGVKAKDRLAAYSIIRIPGHEEDNLGRDIGLADDELARVAHLQATVVHPAFRGNGLQRKMAATHLRVIEDLGFKHVCCTVSPKNPTSLANIICSGLVIKDLRPKFGDWWRYIMYRNLAWPKDLRETLEIGEKAIMGSDLLGQRSLIRDGFVGFRTIMQPQGFVVFYAKNAVD
jgi:hypothetical protein